MRRILIIFIVMLFLLLCAGGVAWLMRGSIAQYYLGQACQDRGFICDSERVSVSLSTLTVEGLSITDTDRTAVARGRVSLDMEWPSAFQPQIRAIVIDNRPNLNLSYDGTALSLGNVPISSLVSQNGGGKMPSIRIEETRLSLETPAGQLSGILSAKGDFPRSGTLQAALTPADLSQDGYRIALNAGQIDLRLDADALFGRLTVDVTEASLPGQIFENAILTVELNEDRQPVADWTLHADRIADRRVGQFNDVSIKGQTFLSERPQRFTAAVLDTIERATFQAEAGSSAAFDRQADRLTANLSLTKTAADGPLKLDGEADFISGMGPFGTAARGTLTIAGGLAPTLESYDLKGRVVATDVAASPQAKARVQSLIPISQPLQAHGQQLRTVLGRALNGFSASADYAIIKFEDVPASFSLNGPVALKANSGADLLITPNDARPVLRSNGDRIEAAGLFSARGGGFPNATLLLESLIATPLEFSVETGGAEIRDWQAGSITLAANLTDFRVSQTTDTPLRVSGNGRLLVDGPLFGTQIVGGEIFGALNAVRTGQNWRVETQNQSCIGFDYDRLRVVENLTLGEAALRLCPPSGRLLSSSGNSVSGALNLGDIILPVLGDRYAGQFNLSNADISWRGDGALTMSVGADQLVFPLDIDGRSVRIDGEAPNLRLSLREDLSFEAALGQSELSGSLVPANIEIRETSLTGTFANGLFRGSTQTNDVRISDFRDDPLYQPVLGDLTANLAGADMTVSGPFRLAATSDLIGFSEASINLLNLTGTARIETPILNFTPSGLKPRQISDRLRGLFSNASGTAQGDADFQLDRGSLSGQGRFTLTDFGFSTSRFGPVRGVNGTVRFNDLIGISTPPGQAFTIAGLNPGLPLSNGEVSFQILQGREAKLERATWPLAGGRLSVTPSRWTISGTEDTVEVRADQIELKQLIDTLKVPDLEAEGTLSGTFPIEFRAGSTFINNARFTVDDKGGRLAYRGAALQNAGGFNETVNDAFRALQNLEYTVLEITLNGNLLGDITLGALMVGRNPEVLAGSEFEFDISIDSKLSQLLQTGREVADQGWLTEAVARQVQDRNSENGPPQE
ncbi:MAG: YdbH domain-containing protein [Pseudomonadota bacterium]